MANTLDASFCVAALAEAIETHGIYEAALARIEQLLHAAQDTPEGDDLRSTRTS